MMLSVVCWKWAARGVRPKFTAEHVNALRAMVGRHYTRPHRFICVTDDAKGIGPGIEVLPDFGDFASVPSPHGAGAPACYRRLRAFHPDAARWFGERFVCLDLDLVAVADLAPLWDRPDDFVMYRDPLYPTQYNGSMVLLAAGSRPEVWADFHPQMSRRHAVMAGKRGSDQGWISYRIPGEATWGPEDGVYSYRKHLAPNGGALPTDARLVVMHGQPKPWSDECQRFEWVRREWGTAASEIREPSRA